MARAFSGLGVTAGLAADRTSMSGMVAGQQFFETDTKLLWYFDGSLWQRVHPAGSVVQTVWARADTPQGFGNAQVLGPLNLTITPRYASSRLLCQWVISGEAGFYNGGFRVAKDGVVATNPPGYNANRGNLAGSIMSIMSYESDYSSTPDTTTLFYNDDATLSTSARTYAPMWMAPGGQSFTLNRSITVSSDSGFEYVVSTGVCFEIIS